MVRGTHFNGPLSILYANGFPRPVRLGRKSLYPDAPDDPAAGELRDRNVQAHANTLRDHSDGLDG